MLLVTCYLLIDTCMLINTRFNKYYLQNALKDKSIVFLISPCVFGAPLVNRYPILIHHIILVFFFSKNAVQQEEDKNAIQQEKEDAVQDLRMSNT